MRIPSISTKNARSLVAGAGLVLLSIGAPNACIGTPPDDVASKGSGVFGDPDIVKRDNLAMAGQLEVSDPSVVGTVSSPYRTDGKWKSLTGHFNLEERRADGSLFVNQNTPVLPGRDFQGPGGAQIGTRAGTMVHGNTYALHVDASDKGGDSFSSEPKFYKLSEDTMVVPVVVVTWKERGDDPVFVNQWYPSKSMLDFNFIQMDDAASPGPYKRPDGSIMTPLPVISGDPLWAGNIDSPDQSFFQYTPNYFETPPDDIWDSCGIQFQIVAEFIAELPPTWQNHCNDQSLNLPNPVWEVQAQLSSNPDLRDYLVNDLRPIYLNYGDLSLCATGYGSVNFFGNTPGMGNRIEVNFKRPPTVSAHELGHSLGLKHAEDPDTHDPIEGNLMRENPINGERKLTDDQCKTARTFAYAYSKRFDYYNRATGRTYSSTPAPAPTRQPPMEDLEFDPSIFVGGTMCCLGEKDVYAGKPGECPGREMPMAACDAFCCDGVTTTRYACDPLAQSVQPGVCPSK